GHSEAAEPFDVDVHELARAAALVAVGRLGRLESRALARPMRFSQRETVESARPSTSAISDAVMRTRRSVAIATTSESGVRLGVRLGREERSRSARSPSA